MCAHQATLHIYLYIGVKTCTLTNMRIKRHNNTIRYMPMPTVIIQHRNYQGAQR